MGKRATVTEGVRRQVLEGHTPKGSLGTLAEIARDHKVSIGTAAAAMGDLQRQGYVRSSTRGYLMADELPGTTKHDEQRAVVTELRNEACRLSELADRLDRAIN